MLSLFIFCVRLRYFDFDSDFKVIKIKVFLKDEQKRTQDKI